MNLRRIFFKILILLSTYEWTNMLYAMFVYYHWNNDKYSPEYSQHNNLEPLSLLLSPNPVYFSALSQLLKQTSLFTVVGEMPLLCLHLQSKHETEVPTVGQNNALWCAVNTLDVIRIIERSPSSSTMLSCSHPFSYRCCCPGVSPANIRAWSAASERQERGCQHQLCAWLAV